MILQYMGTVEILLNSLGTAELTSFPRPKKAPYEICLQSAQWFSRKSQIKMMANFALL